MNKSDLQNISRYVLLPLAIFVLFRKLIEVILLKTVVQHIFAFCYPANYNFDIAISILSIIAILTIWKKLSSGATLPRKWVYAIFTIGVIYLYYRIQSSYFIFTPLAFSRYFVLLDLIFLIPFVAVLGDLLFKKIIHKKIDKLLKLNSKGFLLDEPYDNNDINDDSLYRSKFIRKIALRINNTTSSKSSFAIGIAAAWGAGKTTFLIGLSKELSKSECIIVDFNVWKCNNSNQIIETLFRLLKEKLSQYSFTIDSKLQDYLNALLKGSKNENLNFIKNISEMLTVDSSSEKQYDLLNSEIKRINKKIVIVVDDIDRLDKKEIYEVLRLVRNTANFSNCFFIVAYDRNYILNAVEEINGYQSHFFLEKIFQIEFALPPIEYKTLQNDITDRIRAFLNEKDENEYKNILKTGVLSKDFGLVNLTDKFIYNIRDIIRFVNSFRLRYEFVVNEVKFADFYNIELIRYKYPAVFMEFSNNSFRYLSTTDKRVLEYDSNVYYLKKEKAEDKPVFEEVLRREKKMYKLNDADVDIIISALDAIFPYHDPLYGFVIVNKDSNHLSVVKPSMFGRYFSLGIEGRLSEIHFSKIRSLPLLDFQNEIYKLYTEGTIREVLERFQLIKTFDNREDFEKIIKCIFYMACIPSEIAYHDMIMEEIGYDDQKLFEILQNNKYIKLYYNGDTVQYKKFLFEILTTETTAYTYTNRFGNYLLRHYYDSISDILTEAEIYDILYSNFERAIFNSTELTYPLWWHFIKCENRTVSTSGNAQHISYPLDKRAIKLMRVFVLTKDINGFIKLISIIKLMYNDNYTINGDGVNKVFVSVETFIRCLTLYKISTDYTTEFIKLYQALATNKEYQKNGVPKTFFNVIPVK